MFQNSKNRTVKSTKYNRLKRAKKKSSEGYHTREMYRLLLKVPLFYPYQTPYDKEPTESYTMVYDKRFFPILSEPVVILPKGGM